MNFTLSSILAGLLFGGWGMVLMKKGKKDANVPYMGIGLAMIIYPYFIENDILLWGTGVGLVGIAYFMRNY